MLFYRKISDAAFIQAVLNNDNAIIKEYYRETCLPIAMSLARRFPEAPAEVISSEVNDALITVISQYLKTRKIYVEGGKIVGTKRGKLAALITYIARCGVIRYFKWVKKYGTADIDQFLFELKNKEFPLNEEENNQANEAIMKAFHSLSEKCQEVLSCRLIHGMSYEEIFNEDIGTSIGGLRVKVHNCVKQLRARYLKYFFDTPTK